jgi:hypothetical protein
MASPEVWLEVLSWTKTLFEASKASVDLVATYRKYRADKATINEAARVSIKYSTYSEAEVSSLLRRLNGCRERFVQQGGGSDRARCICGVLSEAIEGNGGTLPEIDGWPRIYSQLGCSRKD